LTYLCSIGNHSLTPENEGAELQCLPLYSILLALGNPTVNYFRQAISRLVTDYKGLALFYTCDEALFFIIVLALTKHTLLPLFFFYHIQ
jgi:hypothetical protein